MSGFSRSLRSPGYLSARRRPAMPGRTFSGSSERSMASDDGTEHFTSGQTTPLQAYQTRQYGTSHPSGNTPNESGPSATSRDYFGTATRPMAIEIPRVNRVNNNGEKTVWTPPAPLSGRGDLPGGYFPMHEDPNTRIHRPHPFHPHNRTGLAQNHALSDSDILGDLDHKSRPPAVATTGPTMPSQAPTSHNNIPVASYYPTGYSENSLPMGKYYPTNYEQRKAAKGKKKRTASTSSVEPESSVPERVTSPPSGANTTDSRTRLQQYQRDMMAQATLRAYELMGSSSKGNKKQANLQALKGVPSTSLGLGASALRRPRSPRLHPAAGSPGPVTPMELESDGAGSGDYLNQGRGSTGESSGTGRVFHANSM